MSGQRTPNYSPSHVPPGRRFPKSLLEESFNAFYIATEEEEATWNSGDDPRVPRSSMEEGSQSPVKSPSNSSSPENKPKPKKKAKGKKKAAAPPVPAATSERRTTRSTTTASPTESTLPTFAPLSRRSTRSSGIALANDEDVDMVMSAQMARELGRSSRVSGHGRLASEASSMTRSSSTGLGAVEEVTEDVTGEATTTAAEAKKNAKKEKRKAQKGKRATSSLNSPTGDPDDDDSPMVDVQ